MIKYRVVYVDEDSLYHDEFKDYLEAVNYTDTVEAICLFPGPKLDEMVDELLMMHPDAIIIDHYLNDLKKSITHNVDYTGSELQKRILSNKQDFPCVILTAYSEGAEEQSDEIHSVYIKGMVFSTSNSTIQKSWFIDKIIKDVNKYKARIDRSETELWELVQKKNDGNASYQDEERIIELDTFLETTSDKRAKIPPEFKQTSYMNRLTEMINLANEILQKYQR